MRTCGTCSLCCKLLGVVELGKPEGVWCRHFVKDVGCGSYSTRPESCRRFVCAWLDERYNLPEHFKPNNIHAVIQPTDIDAPPGITIYHEYPDWHEREPFKTFIKEMVDKMIVMRAHGGKYWQWIDGKWRRFIPVKESMNGVV